MQRYMFPINEKHTSPNKTLFFTILKNFFFKKIVKKDGNANDSSTLLIFLQYFLPYQIYPIL